MSELQFSEDLIVDDGPGDAPSLTVSAAGLALAPSERVLVLAVDLPLASHAQRLAALPFAVEDQVSEPLEELHVALGEAIGPGRYLAAVVRHDLMLDWVAALNARGLARAALTPDALALPRPPEGGWSLNLGPTRALIRTSEGPAFAVPAAMLRSAWEAAGRPTVASYGDAPSDPEIVVTTGLELAPEGVVRPALDLRQGRYAPTNSPLRRAMAQIAVIVGIGMTAHLSIQVADLMVLRHRAAEQRAETEAVARRLAPGVPLHDDLDADLEPLLSSGANASPSVFLPLLARSAAAMAPLSAEASIQEASFTAADRTLQLKVDAGDITGLQRVTAALSAAGLSPTAGPAVAQNGRATGDVVVRDAGEAGRR